MIKRALDFFAAMAWLAAGVYAVYFTYLADKANLSLGVTGIVLAGLIFLICLYSFMQRIHAFMFPLRKVIYHQRPDWNF